MLRTQTDGTNPSVSNSPCLWNQFHLKRDLMKLSGESRSLLALFAEKNELRTHSVNSPTILLLSVVAASFDFCKIWIFYI